MTIDHERVEQSGKAANDRSGTARAETAERGRHERHDAQCGNNTNNTKTEGKTQALYSGGGGGGLGMQIASIRLEHANFNNCNGNELLNASVSHGGVKTALESVGMDCALTADGWAREWPYRLALRARVRVRFLPPSAAVCE